MRHHVSTDAGQRIKATRTKRGLSQRDIESDGVSYAYISRIENGSRTPSMGALVGLADKLKVTAYYLETGRNPPTKSYPCPYCKATRR